MNVVDVLILCSALVGLYFGFRQYYIERRALRERKARAARIMMTVTLRQNDPNPPPPLPNRRVPSDWTSR